MNIKLSFVLLASVQLAVVLYILSTESMLPEYVASNFNGQGLANSYMSHQGYVKFILAFMLGIPALILAISWASIYLTNRGLNIPNRQYWLSEDNKKSTSQYLLTQVGHLAVCVTLFIGYVHWLIVQANLVSPAQLSNEMFLTGLGTFFTFILIWSYALFSKFRRIPK